MARVIIVSTYMTVPLIRRIRIVLDDRTLNLECRYLKTSEVPKCEAVICRDLDRNVEFTLLATYTEVKGRVKQCEIAVTIC
jgi:hypothetical protein